MKNEELIEILKKYNNSKQYIISPIDYSYIFTKDELKKLNDIYIYNQKNGISRDSIINNFMKSYIKEISYICDKIIKDSPITRNEEYIFESFVASKFLNNLNLDIYNSVINRYVNKYLSRKNSEYNNRKLVILMYYLFILIKKEYGNTCQIDFMNVCMENNYFKMAVGALNRKHFNLCINNVFFKDLDKEWSRDEFIFRLMRVYFHILHEKEHIKQFTKVFNGEMNHEIERWKKEMVLTFNSDFYNKYGINFEIEKKANEYALNNVLRYYRMVMGKNFKIEKDFINKYKPKSNDYIPNKEFEKILKDAYEKFVYENPMYLKKVNSYIDKDINNKVIKK